VEPGILEPHEVPAGWGLLVNRGGQLLLESKPLWQEIEVRDRLRLLERIALKVVGRIGECKPVST
jgi:hypothetical protein